MVLFQRTYDPSAQIDKRQKPVYESTSRRFRLKWRQKTDRFDKSSNRFRWKETCVNLTVFRFTICILKRCNGHDSVSFTDALCSIELLKLSCKQLTPCGLPFKTIFLSGVCLLEKI